MAKTLIALLGVAVVLAVVAWAYVQHPKFGPSVAALRSAKVLASVHYVDGEFRNQLPTPLFSDNSTFWSVLWGNLTEAKPQRLRPQAPLPSIKSDLQGLDPAQDVLVWLGHSSFYLQVAGRRMLIDPVFSPYGAPVPFANQAFEGTTPYGAADMPDIDVLLITHSHWDHLDYDSVKALRPKTKRVIVPLGIGAYFVHWGFDAAKVREMDWNEAVELGDGLVIHALPARHYTRRLFETNQTQWVSLAIISPDRRLYFSGDSGYGPHFAEIGRQFGGFDLVALDSGQYNALWPYIHMNPEEAALAAADLGASALLPAHVGRFAISKHAWDEPFDRMVKASAGRPYQLTTPVIGQALALNQPNPGTPHWWDSNTQTESAPMKIILKVDGESLPITLTDNKAAQDFAALLPLTLTLTDYGDVEKISDLPKKLSTTGSPPGMRPEAGDVTYYAPWGNLAIFIGEFSYSAGLLKLGHVERSIDVLRRRGPLQATIEIAP